MRRTVAVRVALIAMAAGGMLAASQAWAQQYPDRAIELVVPYGAGGASDIIARTVGAKLSEAWNVPVTIINTVGAGGTIAGRAVAGAEPDGYTLLIDSSAITQNFSLLRDFPYDLRKDLTPVIQLVSMPFVVAVNPTIEANDLGALVEYARANPDTFNVAVSGTAGRINAELFKLQAELEELTFIPYNGSAPALAAVAANEAQVSFSDITSSMAQIQGGAIRPLAVTSVERAPQLPDVPTARESGLEDYVVTLWQGIFVPAGTDAAIVEKLNAELNSILTDPEVLEKLGALGATTAPNTPAEFNETVLSNIDRWAALISEAGIEQQ